MNQFSGQGVSFKKKADKKPFENISSELIADRRAVIKELHDLHKISLIQISDLYMRDVIHEDTEPKLSVFGQRIRLKNQEPFKRWFEYRKKLKSTLLRDPGYLFCDLEGNSLSLRDLRRIVL